MLSSQLLPPARGPDTRGLLYWTLQFSVDPGPASGLGASRPRLALRLSLGLSADLLSGRLLTESDLVVGSRKVAPESAGLCGVTLTFCDLLPPAVDLEGSA